jgi:hypothetical protein
LRYQFSCGHNNQRAALFGEHICQNPGTSYGLPFGSISFSQLLFHFSVVDGARKMGLWSLPPHLTAHRAAEQRDELAATDHSITSSARPSSIGFQAERLRSLCCLGKFFAKKF